MPKNDSKLSILAIITMLVANPLMLAVILILTAVAFITIYATLIFYGLVSALLYGLGALILIFVVGSFSKTALENHWQIIFLVPAAFVFGWFSDRMGSLGLSFVPLIHQNVVLSQNAVIDGSTVVLYGPYFVSFVALIIAVFALVLTYKVKRKYWWRRL